MHRLFLLTLASLAPGPQLGFESARALAPVPVTRSAEEGASNSDRARVRHETTHRPQAHVPVPPVAFTPRRSGFERADAVAWRWRTQRRRVSFQSAGSAPHSGLLPAHAFPRFDARRDAPATEVLADREVDDVGALGEIEIHGVMEADRPQVPIVAG